MAQPERRDTTEPPAEEARRSRFERFMPLVTRLANWAAAHRALAVTLALCGFVLLSTLAWWAAFGRNDALVPQERLARALAALDRGEYSEALFLAEALRESGLLLPEDLGGPAFLQGAVAAYEAETLVGPKRHAALLLASKYLDEAHKRGFPPGRRGQGLYLLGRSLYESGQIPASRPVLKAALESSPENRLELHRFLAQAYLSDARPRLDDALHHVDQYLAAPNLGPQERYAGLLERARILLRQGELEACLAVLDEIPDDARVESEVILLRGQVQREEARRLRTADAARDGAAQQQLSDEAAAMYRAAIDTFRRAEERDTLANKTTSRAMYLRGVCWLELGELRAALNQWRRVRELHWQTAEGLPAALGEAELERQAGRDAEAVEGYRRVLSSVGLPAQFSNPWLSLEDIRRDLLEAYTAYVDAGKFEEAVALARELGPVVTELRSLDLEAEAQRAWGRWLVDTADGLAPAEAAARQRLGREHLRIAGSQFARLAKRRIATRNYPSDVWNSSISFLDGHNYTTAAKMLEEYLKIEMRNRRPHALVAYGEALASLNRTEEAIAALEECIRDFPRDAIVYRARLLASWTHLERGEVQEAEAQLQANLQSNFLTPASLEWRQSLFTLGRLLYYDGRYREAIEALEEAVERYGDDPASVEARYLIAECRVQLAGMLRDEAERETLETARQAKAREEIAQLDRALERYGEVQEKLNRLQFERALSANQSAMLRNCYFGRGAALVGLGRFEEAIDVYATATNRFQHQPDGLEAYVQIAFCYWRLHQDHDARGTLQQAKVVFNRLPEDAPFLQRTNFDRQQWQQWLDWLSGL